MKFALSDVAESDLGPVLALNDEEVPQLGRIDSAQLGWFAEHAHYFRVARSDGQLAGFLIGLRPGATYASPNYRWFCERYADFGYIDRVAVASRFRRLGLATRLYANFAAELPRSTRMLACEVNLQPPNTDSMHFHERLGFRQVGQQDIEDGAKSVAMLIRQTDRSAS